MAQYPPGRHHRDCNQRQQTDECQPGALEGAPLQRGERLQALGFQVNAGTAVGIGAELGLDNFLGDDCSQDRDQEGAGNHEEPVGLRAHRISGVEQARGRLGKTRQQGVHRADKQIGAVAAGHTGEGRREPGEGMAPKGVENRRCQGNQDHVAQFGGGIGHDAGEYHGHGHHARGGAQYQPAHGGADKARMFGDADPQQGDQYHAERRKAGEIGDQVGDNAL